MPSPGVGVPLRKGDMVKRTRLQAHFAPLRIETALKRSHDDEDHDRDQPQRRQFIDRSEKTRGVAIAAGGKSPLPEDAGDVESEKPRDTKKLGPDPPLTPVDETRGRGEKRPGKKGQSDRRPHDCAL